MVATQVLYAGKWHAEVWKDLSSLTKRIIVYRSLSGGSVEVVEPLVIHTIDQGEKADCMISMSDHDFQSIMRAIVDAAFDDGIKPSQLEDMSGELKQVKSERDYLREKVDLLMMGVIKLEAD